MKQFCNKISKKKQNKTGHLLNFCLAVNLQHPKCCQQSLSLEESVILFEETVRIIWLFACGCNFWGIIR